MKNTRNSSSYTNNLYFKLKDKEIERINLKSYIESAKTQQDLDSWRAIYFSNRKTMGKIIRSIISSGDSIMHIVFYILFVREQFVKDKKDIDMSKELQRLQSMNKQAQLKQAYLQSKVLLDLGSSSIRS